MSMHPDPGIIVLGYKRKDSLLSVLNAIPSAIENHVTIFLDAPARQQDRAICDEVRLAAERWTKNRKCTSLVVSERNLGSVGSIPRAVSYALQQHESVIVLEDDCIPSPIFFTFCFEMLTHYALDSRVGTISGSCLLPETVRTQCNHSYYFSEFTHTWGWATWRRAWSHFDKTLGNISWMMNQDSAMIFRTAAANSHFIKMGINQNRHPYSTSWDFRWLLCSAANNMLCIVPNGNLIHNVGFDPHSTHTKSACPFVNKGHENIRIPIEHPSAIHPWSTADSWWFNTLISKAPISRGRRFINRLIHKHLH
jgi:hypothetical protein